MKSDSESRKSKSAEGISKAQSINDYCQDIFKLNCRFDIDSNQFTRKSISSSGFIDKSMFIERILNEDSRCILITRPRRWGKTMNMRMLEAFLEIDMGENDLGIAYAKDRQQKIDLFKNLKIKDTQIRENGSSNEALNAIDHVLGQWPVVFLSFLNQKNSMTQTLIRSIKKAFKKHEYILQDLLLKELGTYEEYKQSAIPAKNTTKRLLKQLEIIYKNNNLTPFDKFDPINVFHRILYQEFDNEDTTEAIPFLAEQLFNYHGKEVFLLIDEYDNYHQSCLDKIEEFKKGSTILKEFFQNIVKDKNFFKKVVVIGVLDIQFGELGSGANNFSRFGIFSDDYADCFGFTEIEVTNLLTDNMQCDKTKVNEILKQLAFYYNGYSIGNYTLYNPWSIISFLKEAVIKGPSMALKNYWFQTGAVDSLITALKKMKEINKMSEMKQLMNGGIVEVNFQMAENISDVSDINKILFNLLLQSGYLTIDCQNKNCLKIPNNEMKISFVNSFGDILIQKEFGFFADLNELIPRIANSVQDMKAYKAAIQKYLLDHIPETKRNERFFHGILSSIITFTYIANPESYTHQIFPESSVEGKNRIDDLLLPLAGKSNTAIIHEYKVSHNSRNTPEKLENALWQIFINHYLLGPINSQTQFDYDHIKHIIARGVIFFNSDQSEKWGVDMKEYHLKLDQAKHIEAYFSKIPMNKEKLHLKNELNNELSNILLQQKVSLDSIIERLQKESDENPSNSQLSVTFPVKRPPSSHIDN